MRKDHRPFWLKRLLAKLNAFYTEYFIRPQFDILGQDPMIICPRSFEIYGKSITAGNFLHLVSHPLKPVTLLTWSSKQAQGRIDIGDHCLIAPGTQITAAERITIGDNSMIASECILSDCDWHGVYNRIRPFRCTEAITLEKNVWLGTRVIVCKGVTIGENSVVGAGSVVASSIPSNVVAAGNPAKIIRHLNPKRRMLKREFLFQNGGEYWRKQSELDHFVCAENRSVKWLRTLLQPKLKD